MLKSQNKWTGAHQPEFKFERNAKHAWQNWHRASKNPQKRSDRKQAQASKNCIFAHIGGHHVTALAGKKNVRMRKSMGERHRV